MKEMNEMGAKCAKAEYEAPKSTVVELGPYSHLMEIIYYDELQDLLTRCKPAADDPGGECAREPQGTHRRPFFSFSLSQSLPPSIQALFSL